MVRFALTIYPYLFDRGFGRYHTQMHFASFKRGVADEHDSTARDRRTPQEAIRLRIHFSGTNMDTRPW